MLSSICNQDENKLKCQRSAARTIWRLYLRPHVESDAGRGGKGIQHFAMTDRRRATAAMCVCNAASRGRSRSLYSDRGRGRKGSEGPEIA